MPAATDRIFYDGGCGVCHGGMRFIAKRDRGPDFFSFAPIGGETWRHLIVETGRGKLPDSVIVLCGDGSLLVRWRAVRFIAYRLGGTWRLWSICAGIIPNFIGDCCYDCVAKVRYRLARRPKGVCPLVSPEIRKRFEL